MSEQKKTALVTGATAGLGLEFCRQLAADYPIIIAVGRRRERLEELRRELLGQCEVHVVCADLATLEGISSCIEILRQKGPPDMLVNNAGVSTYGEFCSSHVDEQQGMIALHVEAVMRLSRAALPYMVERGTGTIINVSSISSFTPLPKSAVYGATKAFINAFSVSLQEEVKASGITVQALCPGLVRTEIHDTASMAGFDKTRFPDEYWMSAAAVVSASISALTAAEVVVVPGEVNRKIALLGNRQLEEQLSVDQIE
ncbi:MAG: short-subunit dehydrogenase [Halieaceae bacterium]|jgi:short-subunit dehydrogenase